MPRPRLAQSNRLWISIRMHSVLPELTRPPPLVERNHRSISRRSSTIISYIPSPCPLILLPICPLNHGAIASKSSHKKLVNRLLPGPTTRSRSCRSGSSPKWVRVSAEHSCAQRSIPPTHCRPLPSSETSESQRLSFPPGVKSGYFACEGIGCG